MLSILGMTPRCAPVGWWQDETAVQREKWSGVGCMGTSEPQFARGAGVNGGTGARLALGKGQEPAWLLWDSILLGTRALG